MRLFYPVALAAHIIAASEPVPVLCAFRLFAYLRGGLAMSCAHSPAYTSPTLVGMVTAPTAGSLSVLQLGLLPAIQPITSKGGYLRVRQDLHLQRFDCRLTGERRCVSCTYYPVGIPAMRFWAIGTRVFNLSIILTNLFALDRFKLPCISLFHHTPCRRYSSAFSTLIESSATRMRFS